MIFGWGSGSTQLPVPNDLNKVIITTFGYIHIAFLLRLTFNRKWFLAENQKIDESGAITLSQKPLTKQEVDDIYGKNPINPFWIFFNQSFVWIILVFVLAGGIMNYARTGNPLTTPPRTVAEIMASRSWTQQEEQFVVDNATDEEFMTFLTKFRIEDNLKLAMNKRIKAKGSVSGLSNSISSSSRPAKLSKSLKTS
jgi:hypothetical protein